MVEVIHDFPAYKIIQTESMKFEDDEKIGVPYVSMRGDTLYNFYRLGRVGKYAEDHGDDVQEAIDRAISLGHELHYAYGLGVSITSHKQPHETIRRVQIGDVIEYDGKKFEIKKAPNHNISLVEVND